MKKLFLLIAVISLFALSGCRVITDYFSPKNTEEELVVQVPQNTEIPSIVSPDVMPNADIPAETEVQPPVLKTNYIVQEANIELIYPETFSLAKNIELNRRGSFTSYNFFLKDKADGPILQEVQFFTEKSIQDFNEECEGQGYPCFFGDYPTVDEYLALKKAFQDISDYKEFYVLVFNERNYFVKTSPCGFDSCVKRQYTTYFDDIRVDVWINMAEDTQSEAADALFKQVIVMPVGERES